ncbi:hypothetical protein OG906_00725 [Streptomyces sp. NBC_01426]|uniref:hypothetical protein n=1 Tax=Streptomyces sp. NBC_01426 TaxID=2975866 RepID=UPI002E343837|nr:hypothetical protein [Streptomyces sp. NBC_01426]
MCAAQVAVLPAIPEDHGIDGRPLVDKASDKLGDVTDQLQDVAEGNGKLSDVAGIHEGDDG